MSSPFNPDSGLVLVYAEIEGPSGIGIVRLALDTGAATTVINPPRVDETGLSAVR
jgi:hypothetical protein